MVMATSSRSSAGPRILAFLTVAALLSPALSQTCTQQQVDNIVTPLVQTALQGEVALAAGLLRIFFHDCFPNGCDASIYLRGTGTEQAMGPNLTLQPRALQLIEDIRAKVHLACGGATVSCADISALATRAVVVLSGVPKYAVPFGVLDSLAPASQSAVGSLPSPFTSSVSTLAGAFSGKGLTAFADLVALSGAHTVGRAVCSSFSDRSGKNGDAFGKKLRDDCTRNPNLKQNLDVVTPDLIDNGYYKALVANQGVFTSDMALIKDSRTAQTVRDFSNSKDLFFAQFAKSMAKLAAVPRSGGGEIRRSCFSSNNA